MTLTIERVFGFVGFFDLYQIGMRCHRVDRYRLTLRRDSINYLYSHLNSCISSHLVIIALP
jgi:hypothetical protein